MVRTTLALACLLALPAGALAQQAPRATPVAASPTAPATAKPKKPPSPKQLASYDRMRKCNAEAREKDLHGDPRKAFMKGCLSTHAQPST
jgi:hypothetical protein